MLSFQSKRLIPIEICHKCLQHRWYNRFRTYLVLNFNCDGYIDQKSAVILLMKELGIDRKTAKSHLHFCIDKNWLGICSNTIYIRSIDFIRKKENTLKRASVWLNYKDIKHFKALCFAALITQISKDLRRMQQVYKREKTYQKLHSFYPISGNLIKKRYSISNSVSSRLRKKAKEHGFLDYKQNLIPFSSNKKFHFANELPFIKSNLDPKVAKRLSLKDKKVNGVQSKIIYIQETIKMKSNLIQKRRKKINSKMEKIENYI